MLKGSYLPSFFRIKLNCVDDIYNQTILGNDVLFHEYIHFLQDLTTTSGYEKLYNSFETLKYIRVEVKDKDDIHVPYQIENPDNKENVELYNLIDGDDDFKCETYKIVDVNENPLKDFPSAFSLKVECADGEKAIPFGSYQIEEIMAECCESQHALYKRTDAYPYDLWEKLNEFYDMTLTQNNYALICFVSLKSPFPGNEFITIMKMMQKEGFKNDILEASFKRNKEMQKKLCSLAIKSMREFFATSPFKLNEWYADCIDKLSCYCSFEKYSALITNMLQPGSEFNEFVKKVSLPIVCDRKGNYGFGENDKIEPQHFYALVALDAIKFLLEKGEKICPMKQMCIAKEKEINACAEKKKMKANEDNVENHECGAFMTIDCECSPWNYVSGDKLCYYSTVWKMLGFEGKNVIID